jgi:uncharacterized protein (DUF1697 family)
MARLRELFAELGLRNVRTYIQSGNVFFDTTRANRTALTSKIERHLSTKLGYEVPTFVRTPEEIEDALALQPFKRVKVTPKVRLCVALISQPLPKDLRLPASSEAKDIDLLAATPGLVFALVHVKNGKWTLPSAFLEKRYKLKSTTRWYATTMKILEAAKSPADAGKSR